ncbi:hypothetical protein DMN91_000253 [Ooceraea biroi]|uniref:Endonuclease-reverse transcriptase n=1 Tax=Ooceraea biroi TaxID=2015173 RepID=A0A3L8E3C1_OOCBI|nr:hypothetical protein DMN91_000253 [Ooceraea biroi]
MKERKNIIVRGMSTEGTLEECTIRIQTLLRDKLKVDSKVWQVRRSGRVLIARLEMKRKVMKSKSKLGTERVFIENDLTWEERRVQEEITRWAKDQRGKGMEIKVATGKVRVGEGVWKWWSEVKREQEVISDEGRRDEREKSRRAEGGQAENFV